jgi:methyl-accepting chemotaxis protein
VTDAMQSISAVVEENTAATEEMAAQSAEVDAAIQGIAKISETQRASVEEIAAGAIAAGAEEMSAQVAQIGTDAASMAATAENLEQLVRRFKLEQDGAADYSHTKFVRLRRVA